jgi:diamine N-acetyltransferase
MILSGAYISLRALEPEDLEFLFRVENDTQFWEVSHTQTPFSKYTLKKYLENAHQDIYEAKQLRLMIVENESKVPVGMIDLFDFDPQHRRAGIGILIDADFQQQGFAFDALSVLIQYAFQHLNLHQLYANITPDNTNSIGLFEKCGFSLVGEKKDWLLINGTYKNELLFQLIHE